MSEKIENIPNWFIKFLKYTAFYHLTWGVFILSQPLRFWSFFQLEAVTFPKSLYVLGIVILLMGFAYLYTAKKPLTWFWYLLFAALAKTIGFVSTWFLANESTPLLNLILHTVFNDLIWIPFFLWGFYILFKEWQNTENENLTSKFPDILNSYKTNQGNTLAKIQKEKAIMLVFLRHFGCTFCRETLLDLAEKRDALEKNTQIIFVHMANEEEGTAYLKKYRLDDLEHVSDLSCELYRSFSIKRANFWQVFGFKTWFRGFKAGVLKKQGVGKLVGDGFRMAGVFVIYQNKILEEFRHKTAADIPDYHSLSLCEIPNLEESNI